MPVGHFLPSPFTRLKAQSSALSTFCSDAARDHDALSVVPRCSFRGNFLSQTRCSFRVLVKTGHHLKSHCSAGEGTSGHHHKQLSPDPGHHLKAHCSAGEGSSGHHRQQLFPHPGHRLKTPCSAGEDRGSVYQDESWLVLQIPKTIGTGQTNLVLQVKISKSACSTGS